MSCVQVYALLACRRRPSWRKKGMFSNVEEPPLVAYSAFSRKEKGAACEISWHFLFTWLVFFHSWRTFLSLTDEHRWTEHTAFHRGLAPDTHHRTLQIILAVRTVPFEKGVYFFIASRCVSRLSIKLKRECVDNDTPSFLMPDAKIIVLSLSFSQ